MNRTTNEVVKLAIGRRKTDLENQTMIEKMQDERLSATRLHITQLKNEIAELEENLNGAD